MLIEARDIAINTNHRWKPKSIGIAGKRIANGKEPKGRCGELLVPLVKRKDSGKQQKESAHVGYKSHVGLDHSCKIDEGG